jgi:hypothetical protein
MTRTLNLESIARFRHDGSLEQLQFDPGVNVILGGDNAGKTEWLRLVDYLLADSGSPSSALGEVAKGYTGADLAILIDGRRHVISRMWDDDPGRGQLLIDDRRVDPIELSDFLLDSLGLPRLRFPKGRDLAQQQWPRLGWRTLLRQIYRREDSWSDLAHQQPDAEQFVVLATFLGISASTFPAEGQVLAERSKRRFDLVNRKAHFESMLDEIGRELVSLDEIGQSVTQESIQKAVAELNARVRSAQDTKDERLLSRANVSLEQSARVDIEGLSRQLTDAHSNRQRANADANAARERVRQLSQYKATLEEEIGRVRRAQVAGQILSPLRATHCPVCDQSVSARVESTARCYLCLQDLTTERTAHSESSIERIEFEIQQLGDEIREIDSLIERVHSGAVLAGRLANDAADEVSRIETELAGLRRPISWIVPPEIGEIDQEIGRLTERLRQLRRLEGTLELRERFSAEIDQLGNEIALLEEAIAKKEAEPDFQAIGDLFADGINDYLNNLNRAGRSRWGRRRVTVDVGANEVLFLVDGKRWTNALGANLRAYLLMGLHYSLLKLRGTQPFCYPGLVILDFPPDLSRRVGLSDDENYLLGPFIDLTSGIGPGRAQVIAAGRAFRGLEKANTISLSTHY